MLPTEFQVSWPFDSEEEAKIDFQDGRHDRNDFIYFLSISHPDNGGHFGFPLGRNLAIFALQVTPMLPTKFLRQTRPLTMFSLFYGSTL